jgi:hypothetical protein
MAEEDRTLIENMSPINDFPMALAQALPPQ